MWYKSHKLTDKIQHLYNTYNIFVIINYYLLFFTNLKSNYLLFSTTIIILRLKCIIFSIKHILFLNLSATS